MNKPTRIFSIALLILVIFVAGMVAGTYVDREHKRARRVQELKANMLDDNISEGYFIELALELRKIAK